MDKIKQAESILKKYNQEHIKVENEEIANQILNIDFELLNRLYNQAISDKIYNSEKIEPIKPISQKRLDKQEKADLINLGENAIKSGELAITVLAGGQGTRLDHSGPKGTFEMKLNNEKKSFFEIIISKLKEAQEKYNVTLNCYIMTSPENNDDTIKFFENKNYFGYPKDKIKFFKQDVLPLLNKDGKLIMDEDGLIKEASNGNGGVFDLLNRNGIIEEMKQTGIKWMFIGPIDNLLAKYIDPLLLGLTIRKNAEVATRTVMKQSVQEKVGAFCRKNGKVKVIEYSEIPEDMRLAIDENDEIVYGDLFTVCSIYSVDALKTSSTGDFKYHIAVKKQKYIDENGKIIIPETPNCYKFEKFIFDSFDFFDDILVLRGNRAEDFAPIKNREGLDSIETATKLYEEYMKEMV